VFAEPSERATGVLVITVDDGLDRFSIVGIWRGRGCRDWWDGSEALGQKYSSEWLRAIFRMNGRLEMGHIL
jgi:hypothetical protein